MKKITLLLSTLFLTAISWQSSAQIFLQENFDASIPGTWIITDGGTAIGDSWISGQQGGANNLDGTNGAIVDSDANGNGQQLIETLESPIFNSTGATALFLEFDQYFNGDQSGDFSQVEVFDGATWQVVLNQTADIGNFGTPDRQMIDITALANANMQVRFIYDDNNVWAWWWMIDNVIIHNVTCPQPTALNAAAITTTTADLSWIENGTATTWDIEWGTTGFAPTGTPTIAGTTTNPHNLTGLTAATTYDFYVRADCGAGDLSLWSGPFTFTTLVSCPAPSALTATAITATSADLGWTENGTATLWDIEWGTTGFAPTGTPTIAGTTTNPHNLTGLTAATTYDFYVRADCGGVNGVSTWTGPFTFTTLCATIPAPWMDDVEAHATTTNLGLSNCWNAIGTGYDWNIDGAGSTPSGNTGPTGAFSGVNYFYIEASGSATGDTADLLSPMVDLTPLTAPLLEFYYHMFGVVMGDLYVDVWDGATWTTVDSILGQQQVAQADPWLKRSINLSAFSGTIQIRFRAVGGGSFEGDISLDDINVRETPSCPDPTALMASNVIGASADLSWTENGSATSWEIEWGATGFVQGAGTSVITATNPHNLTGLTPVTTYDFYVRSVCAPGDTSLWVGPFTFTTTVSCPAPTAQTVTNFTPTSADLGWTENGAATSWEIEWGATGFVQGAGTSVITATNPHNLTGLTANTTYDFYVRAVCGPADSSLWTGVFTFTTPCTATVAPFMDSIETHTPTTALTNSNCWNATATGTYGWDISGTGNTPSTGTGPTVAFSGTNFFFTEASNGAAGDVAELVSPLIDVTPLAIPSIEFYYHMFGTDMGNLYVDVWDGATWTTLDSIMGQQQAAQADPWLLKVVDISTYTGIIQVRFRAISAGTFEGDISLDNIEVKESTVITCIAPNNLTTSNVANTTVDLGWTELGTATTWEIEWDTAGFVPGTGNTVITTTNPHNLTGLTANTAYDFYVRAICGPADSSTWTGPSSFNTLNVGIDEVANNINLAVYPNPSNGIVTLSINTTNINELEIKIMNLQGQIVFAKNNFDNVSIINELLDLSSNAKGIYFIRVTSDKGIVTRKMILQ